jgi:L-asparaginase II
MTSFVQVTRGDLIESRHRLSIAIAGPDGRLVAWSGDPQLVTFWRSAAKFFQAVPLVADGAADALGVTEEELALACASHNGETRHAEVARVLLGRSGASEADLVCGPHSSLSDAVAKTMAQRGEKPTKAHNNCSGKHAGMIAVGRHAGWGSDGYHVPTHQVQRRCLEEVSRWTGIHVDGIPHGTDGCGVPSFALPLAAMATAYARLGAAVAGDDVPSVPAASLAAMRRLIAAVRAHPFLLAGTGRLDTELLEITRGRVLAKIGAEGVYSAVIPDLRLGLAFKVEDGATRALAPALLALLDQVAPGVVQGLESHRRPGIANTLGRMVGSLEPCIELHRGAKD